MISLLEKVVTATHRHPLFSLAMVIFLAFWVNFSFKNFATAADLDQLRGEVFEIRVVFERGQIEQRIYGLESDIYELERVLAEGRARDIDHARLARLRSELGGVKRELARVDRQSE